MLSKADVALLLAMMQQFDSFIEVNDLSVEAWYELLAPVIDDVQLAKDAVLNAYRSTAGRVTPGHVIDRVEELRYEVAQAGEQYLLWRYRYVLPSTNVNAYAVGRDLGDPDALAVAVKPYETWLRDNHVEIIPAMEASQEQLAAISFRPPRGEEWMYQ